MTSFIISDTHFGHEKCWSTFKNYDGTPMRPFSSTEEMDEFMIDQWNKTVHPKDTVYHLGDVVIKKGYLDVVKRLNGKKRLIRGNHDIFKDKDYYAAGFEQILGVRVFVDKWIMSHIPLHPDNITGRYRVNVHGHTHANKVRKFAGVNDDGSYVYSSDPDPRYFCACVEQINYTPISFEDVEASLQKRWEDANHQPKYTVGSA